MIYTAEPKRTDIAIVFSPLLYLNAISVFKHPQPDKFGSERLSFLCEGR
jgi:hypothetical protein